MRQSRKKLGNCLFARGIGAIILINYNLNELYLPANYLGKPWHFLGNCQESYVRINLVIFF